MSALTSVPPLPRLCRAAVSCAARCGCGAARRAQARSPSFGCALRCRTRCRRPPRRSPQPRGASRACQARPPPQRCLLQRRRLPFQPAWPHPPCQPSRRRRRRTEASPRSPSAAWTSTPSQSARRCSAPLSVLRRTLTLRATALPCFRRAGDLYLCAVAQDCVRHRPLPAARGAHGAPVPLTLSLRPRWRSGRVRSDTLHARAAPARRLRACSFFARSGGACSGVTQRAALR